LAIKIGLSFLATALSFLFIENPARVFLNQGRTRSLAFASLGVCPGKTLPSLPIDLGFQDFGLYDPAFVSRQPGDVPQKVSKDGTAQDLSSVEPV
jgi:hypothetical protein